MPTDRITGFDIGVAIKPACVAATTGNITLSGAQTIDGISVGGNSERVLVKSQTTTSQNGIYIADSSTWVRAKDCDGSRDLLPGSVVYVDRGSVNARKFYVFNSSSTASSIAIGTDALTLSDANLAVEGVSSWVSANFFPVTSASSARSVLGAVSSTEAATVSSTNTFSVTQAFSTGVTFGGDITVSSTLSSSAAAPALGIYRNSTSPAAADELGVINFLGKSAGSTQLTYAQALTEIVDPTVGSEDGRIALRSVVASSLANRLFIGAGVYTPGSSGGDLGAGTINSSAGVFKNNVEYGPGWTYTAQISATGLDTSLTLSTAIAGSAMEIEVLFNALSMSSGPPIVRVGTDSGAVSTGYTFSIVSFWGGNLATTPSPSGFLTHRQSYYNSTGNHTGILRISRWASTEYTWVADIVMSDDTTVDNSQRAIVGSGVVTLSGELSTIVVTSTTGNSQCDGGEVRVRYR